MTSSQKVMPGQLWRAKKGDAVAKIKSCGIDEVRLEIEGVQYLYSFDRVRELFELIDNEKIVTELLHGGFKPGDVVRLKSGGPPMTVEHVTNTGKALCSWFTMWGEKEQFNSRLFDALFLEPAAKDQLSDVRFPPQGETHYKG